MIPLIRHKPAELPPPYVNEVGQALVRILGDGEKLEVQTYPGGYELSYGKMYTKPGLTFGMLKELSALFGSDSIDVDEYSRGGCDTCDYGSDYGHTIQLTQITQNEAGLKELVGIDLMKPA